MLIKGCGMSLERTMMKQDLPRRALGFTLVELMVGILVGLILLAAVISVFVASVRANSATLTMAQLNHEVRSVAEIVANELRRSGFDRDDRDLENIEDNDYVEVEISADRQCIRYAYNRSVGPDQSFGFNRVVSDGVGRIEMKAEADDTTCASWDSVAAASLTDDRRVNITGFEVQTGNSRCFNLALRNLDDPLDTWSWVPTTLSEFPCDQPATLPATQTGDVLIEHRQLLLTVSGEALNPAGQAGTGQPLRATFTTEIHLPNHRRVFAVVP